MDWQFIVFGVVIVLGIILSVWQDRRRINELERTGIRVQGVVVANKFRLGRSSVFRPVIRFQTQRGEIIELEDKKGAAMAIPKFSKGQQILLLYEENNPSNFTIISAGYWG